MARRGGKRKPPRKRKPHEERPTGPRPRIVTREPPRIKSGAPRADGAVDWVSGRGTQDAQGRLHIEHILGTGHAQAQALHRAILAEKPWVLGTGKPIPGDRMIVMPVDAETAVRVRTALETRLEKARRSGHRTRALACRIGLGRDTESERKPVPLSLQSGFTRADGSTARPLPPEAYAVLDDGLRLHGKLAAGKELDSDAPKKAREAEFGAGLGPRVNLGKNDRVPRIVPLLAVDENAERAAIRAIWIAERFLKDHLETMEQKGLKCSISVVPIPSEDAAAFRRAALRAGNNAKKPAALAGIGKNPEVERIASIEEIAPGIRGSGDLEAAVDAEIGDVVIEPESGAIIVW